MNWNNPKNQILYFILFILLATLLSNCSSMSKERISVEDPSKTFNWEADEGMTDSDEDGVMDMMESESLENVQSAPPPPPPPAPMIEEVEEEIYFFDAETAQPSTVVENQKLEVIETKKETTSKTWKRKGRHVNSAKVFVGDQDTLVNKGCQVAIKIDGFRVRVFMDCYFYNDKDRQLEGTFKLVLPTGASPYYFAFGEEAILDKDKDFVLPITDKYKTALDLSVAAIRNRPLNDKATLKEARLVPKEKAAFAYAETTRRKIDPLLAEWTGSDIFNCRVFPLLPNKVHRIAFGYDLNLNQVNETTKSLYFPLPETRPLEVDINMSDLGQISANMKGQKIENKKENGRWLAHLDNPKLDAIQIFQTDAPTTIIHGKQSNDSYFATNINPQLPGLDANQIANQAVFLVDVSLSSNPDKYNVWLKALEAILKENENDIKQFAIQYFNVESFWWKTEWVNNTAANRTAALAYANSLSLEGASDLGSAILQLKEVDFISKNSKAKNVFLLSDGSITWGEDRPYALSEYVQPLDKWFAFQTGMAETNRAILAHLTRNSGGAIFSIANENQIKKASTAFKKQAWKIESLSLENTKDLLIEGRPLYLYQGQNITVVGRGTPSKGSQLKLTVSNNGTNKTISIPLKESLQSNLAARTYGQYATEHLEEFEDATLDFSTAYSTHFRVPGKTCSFLMLESEEDYARYNIKPETNAYVVRSSSVNSLVDEVLKNVKKTLGNAKLNFIHWVEKLEKFEGLNFEIPTAFQLILDQTPEANFKVAPAFLNSALKLKKHQSSELTKALNEKELDYDVITKAAKNIQEDFDKSASLKILSSLIEKNPGNGVLARDVAFSAMEYNLSSQAYHLLTKVIRNRPYEPQSYTAIAQALTDIGKIDLAIFYYEVALSGQWDQRFGAFRQIAALDYSRLLRLIEEGKYEVSFPDYISSRKQSIDDEFNFKSADLVITITWNTDNTDIDLHVKEPTGEVCYYSFPKTKIGGLMSDDVTQGYGPEMYILQDAKAGEYLVGANYYGSDRSRTSVRSKVFTKVYKNFGSKNEELIEKVISLGEEKQMVDIFEIKIKEDKKDN